jgi:hypothetical protein
MLSLDKKYAKMLNGLSGSQLTDELRQVVATIKSNSGSFFDQRTRDRGSYLVLENLGRVPEADQEELLKSMLEANPKPSRGVLSHLMGWKPKKMPAAVTLAAIAGVIGTGFTECLKQVQDGAMSPDLFHEIEKILVAQDNLETAAYLAEKFTPERLPDLVDLMMAQVIDMVHQEADIEATNARKSMEEWDEMPPEEVATIMSKPSAFQIKSRREKLAHTAVDLSIKHKIKAPLARMRGSAELNYGNDLYVYSLVPAAVIHDDPTWHELAIQKVIEDGIITDRAYELAELAFGLVKQDRFANYRQQLFNAVYRGRITNPPNSTWYQVKFLELLAEMAVYFQNKLWQDQVYRAAMREIPKGLYGHSAYDAIEVLAPVHPDAQRIKETMPRPVYRIVLR